MPVMPLSEVRISWLTAATKRVFMSTSSRERLRSVFSPCSTCRNWASEVFRASLART